jgi:hypothetical protein
VEAWGRGGEENALFVAGEVLVVWEGVFVMSHGIGGGGGGGDRERERHMNSFPMSRNMDPITGKSERLIHENSWIQTPKRPVGRPRMFMR